MPVSVPSDSVPAVKDSVEREKRIVQRKLERYRDRLDSFEQEYEMSTEEFMEQFSSGELGDDEDWFEWKFAATAYDRLKEKLAQLEQAMK